MTEPIQGNISINTENIEQEEEQEEEKRRQIEEKRRQIEEKRRQIEEKRRQEEEEKRRQEEEEKRREEEEEKRRQEEEEKRRQEEEEEKRRQEEEEEKQRQIEKEKKHRNYDENYDGNKTIFLQMPMVSLFSKTYKLLYIPYTFKADEMDESTQENKGGGNDENVENNKNITEESESTIENNESNSLLSWFSFSRNDKFKQINIEHNLIKDYVDSTFTREMKEYKSFVVNTLYIRLIFTINKSKEVSLYDLFFYYIIDIVNSDDKYTLNNLEFYRKDLSILKENNSKLDIFDMVKAEPNQNAYYVYIYDVINNKMLSEYNTTNIEKLYNINIANTATKYSKKRITNTIGKNVKYIKKTIGKTIKSTPKTLKRIYKNAKETGKSIVDRINRNLRK